MIRCTERERGACTDIPRCYSIQSACGRSHFAPDAVHYTVLLLLGVCLYLSFRAKFAFDQQFLFLKETNQTNKQKKTRGTNQQFQQRREKGAPCSAAGTCIAVTWTGHSTVVVRLEVACSIVVVGLADISAVSAQRLALTGSRPPVCPDVRITGVSRLLKNVGGMSTDV